MPGNWPAWFGPGVAGKGSAHCRHLASGLPVCRLRLAGLIRRTDHANRYALTPDGIKVAVFYTKLHNRLLRPLLAADQPQAPAELRDALHVIHGHIDDYISRARLAPAA